MVHINDRDMQNTAKQKKFHYFSAASLSSLSSLLYNFQERRIFGQQRDFQFLQVLELFIVFTNH
jgi:hypothetical protein